MKKNRKTNHSRKWLVWIFFFLMLFSLVIISLRFFNRPKNVPEDIPEPVQTVTPTQMVDSGNLTAVSPSSTEPETEKNAAQTAPTKPQEPELDEPVENAVEELPPLEAYTEESYSIVNDMVYTYQYQRADGIEAARELVEKLKETSPGLGSLWNDIMEYWFYVNDGLVIHTGVLPEGLPEDDSLCIVVLGFQLESDGSMAPELLGRCQVALDNAEKYPNSFIAVTGGGTASINTSATEAGVMADWFMDHGLDESRIIVEDSSMTTDQNAEFTCKILLDQYPQVHSLAIVSSDYHIPLGSLMFQEMSILYRHEYGSAPFTVVSNAAYATRGDDFFTDPHNQAPYVWFMAGPSYG